VILDAGGEELKHAISHAPDLVVAETSADPGPGGSEAPDLGATLIRMGAGAAAVTTGHEVTAVTADGEWVARIAASQAGVAYPSSRGALVAGLVPGQLLGWSWPDRLRHALALAAGGVRPRVRGPGQETGGDEDHVDLVSYERLLDAVTVDPRT
jgi:fructose-1-phosphate kinase PfkB-like protein